MKNVQIIKIMITIKKLTLLTLLAAAVLSCDTSKKESVVSENKVIQAIDEVLVENKGLLLLQQKCYACHSITSKSHDEIIAPPMVAVKRRYKMSYTTEEEFVDAVTNWVMHPQEENALMKGAITNFNMMPQQPFDRDEIIIIAAYMYQNELEKPVWFQKHFNEEHPNGMGNGNGNGKGMGKGKGNGNGMRNGNF